MVGNHSDPVTHWWMGELAVHLIKSFIDVFTWSMSLLFQIDFFSMYVSFLSSNYLFSVKFLWAVLNEQPLLFTHVSLQKSFLKTRIKNVLIHVFILDAHLWVWSLNWGGVPNFFQFFSIFYMFNYLYVLLLFFIYFWIIYMF